MALVDLVMPKMGESITEATILRWFKKVGDAVKMDETVLDIATDKVDSEVPSIAAGIIKEILYDVNAVVPVGAILARIETEVFETVVVKEPATILPVVETAPVASLVEETAGIDIPTAIPQPIESVQEYVPFVPAAIPSTPLNNRFFSPLVLNIANSEGLSLSELERIPGTGADGRVSKKDVLQYIADKRGGKLNIVNTPVAAPQEFVTSPVTVAAPVSVQENIIQPIENNLSVAVAKQENDAYPIATEVGVASAAALAATAWLGDKPKEAIEPLKEDIQEIAQITTNAHDAMEEVVATSAAVAETAVNIEVASGDEVSTTPQPTTPIVNNVIGTFSGATYKNAEIVEMDRMRKLIAKHMVQSKQTSPHVTSFAEADVTNMVNWRSKIKDEFEKREGMKITFTPMFIECVLKVMKHYPIINSSVDGDKIIMKKDINIGMATALPSGNLIVPVIKNADELNFVNLTRSVNTLATNAREGKLKADDVTEGTFTITNVGTFGSIMGTPIINQPQVAILAVGEIKKRPVVIETDKGDFIGIRHMMYLSLSYDHRIVDGSIGASFLSDIAKEMEAWDVNRQLKYVVKEWYVE
jgi:2-oxoglutarate dehydrogenase E2 component (dihydrolipoamide succinyltransferase)